MESGDENNSNMHATVREFLNTILEEVIADMEKMQRQESINVIHDIVNDALQRVVETTAENTEIFSDENKVYSQENHILKEIVNDAQQKRSDNDEYKVREEDISITNPPESQNFDVSEDFSKSAYLESRLRLYTSMLRGPKKETDENTNDRPCVKDMLTEYTFNVNKGEREKTEIKYQNENGAEHLFSICDEIVPNIREAAGSLDVTSFTSHLEVCTNRYRYLQGKSISSLRAECLEHSSENKISDAKVLVKADILKGKVFPKFSKVKKIKTKYGKVKIHFSDTLSKEEQERIVKKAEEMLKMAKQEELEDKKQQKEMRNKRGRSFGARIGDFFRRLSCCKNYPDE